MPRIGVLGSGAWATTIGKVLADAGHQVTLGVHRKDYLDAINQNHENATVLEGIPLPHTLNSTLGLDTSTLDAMIIAVPSAYLESALGRLSSLSPSLPLLSLIKGIVNPQEWFASRCIAKQYPNNPIAVLSGPNLAKEIALGNPAASVIASGDTDCALFFQSLFNTSTLRIYTASDVDGVELGGVFKNIVACAAGVCDGLQLGVNAKAALITRSLTELESFATFFGGSRDTFSGLSGIGDLMATCFSKESRNWNAGFALASHTNMMLGSAVAEGIRTTRFLAPLAEQHGLDTPITQALYSVIEGKQPAHAAVLQLLSRRPKSE